MYFPSVIRQINTNRIEQEIRNYAENRGFIGDISNLPDILLITEPKKNSIGIDHIKKAISFSISKPYNSNQKLIFIFPAETLTIQAQNALLKLLEEPPKFVEIVLLATNTKSLLQTIISRCQIEYSIDDGLNETTQNQIILETNDMADRFLLVDRIMSSPSGPERMEQIKSFLDSSYEDTINKLKQITDKLEITKYKNRLILIQDAYKKLQANTNTRLVLENFVINY